ncbi:MAG: hypothetical protein GY847_01215 [Proteobacteria bacterium]|nr:hypothetical protein [Pseudomonadota bacterium]
MQRDLICKSIIDQSSRQKIDAGALGLFLLLAVGCARAPSHPRIMDPRRTPYSLEAASEEQVVFVPVDTSSVGPTPRRGAYYLAHRRGVSRTCTGGSDPLWFCAEDRWLAGEHRDAAISYPGDGADGMLTGTDLGRSVRLGNTGRTFFYMGDSFGEPDQVVCGAANPRFSCNDAVLVVDGPSSPEPADDGVPRDTDASDGIRVAVAVGHGSGGERHGFWPVVIPGVNGEDALPLCAEEPEDDSPCLGKFSVPTGAVSVRLPASLIPNAPRGVVGDVDVVLLFYGTATAIQKDARNEGARFRGSSFLAASTDGLHFELIGNNPFSRGKFLIVATAPLSQTLRERTCAEDPVSPLCDAALGLDGDAVLLFGVGQPPRRSPLHLGILRLSDLAVFYYHFDPQTGRESWSSEEEMATPIIEVTEIHRPGKKQRKDLTTMFGETQATIVPKEACPPTERARCSDTLLLLANQGFGVFLRSAPLSRPGARSAASAEVSSWSRAVRTSAAGYGPFFIDDFTLIHRTADGELELEMYHTVSGWDGKGFRDSRRNPYGVFTRRLRLLDEENCIPSRDGSGIPICKDFLPPWPLDVLEEGEAAHSHRGE